ncbi:DNA-binding transcriptional regulator, FadR family [Actinacidiphila alni]|uniref:DNA-binding transcriptional regulator, FadR family n=1 Tax=Actinacidiphila alni TaxID=380248 RepID=A0A1I2CKG7_9ACTN|nr:GntR family transcriptional regulator [Actinacidiphila alni]SFE68806.1 DNA-binding transcriptional regulator, FadR family [Actinacidiphila alni]
MTVGTPRPSPLVEQAAQHLRERIAAGRWPVGARLPGETALAASLGVGRSTVREAVRALAGAGMLRTRQGAGVFVIAAEPVEEWSVRLGRAATADVHEVRALLEARAVRMAARRRTEQDITALRAALARQIPAAAVPGTAVLETPILEAAVLETPVPRPAQSAAGPGPETSPGGPVCVDAHLALHSALVAAAGNPVLTGLFAEFAPALRAAELRGRPHPADPRGHEALVGAVVAGDADTAERLLTAELDGLGRAA